MSNCHLRFRFGGYVCRPVLLSCEVSSGKVRSEIGILIIYTTCFISDLAVVMIGHVLIGLVMVIVVNICVSGSSLPSSRISWSSGISYGTPR